MLLPLLLNLGFAGGGAAEPEPTPTGIEAAGGAPRKYYHVVEEAKRRVVEEWQDRQQPVVVERREPEKIGPPRVKPLEREYVIPPELLFPEVHLQPILSLAPAVQLTEGMIELARALNLQAAIEAAIERDDEEALIMMLLAVD